MAAEPQYLPHQIKEWADWRIIEAGPDIGKLYDSRTGEMFSPGEISTTGEPFDGLLTTRQVRILEISGRILGEASKFKG